MSLKAAILAISSPPLPYFLECGKTVYQIGDQHPNRTHIGVFDLIIVEQGKLHMGEEDQKWTINQGQMLILLPNRYHYAVKACSEQTQFYWIHFEILGEWEEMEEHSYQYDDLDEKKEEYLHLQEHKVSSYTIKLPKVRTIPYPEQIYNYSKKL